MRFYELVEEVLENLSLVPSERRPQRGEVKRLLNLAMSEISFRVGMPTANVLVPGTGLISAPFNLPVRYRPDGPIRATLTRGVLSNGHEVHHEREIPIYSASVAVSHHPNFDAGDDYCGPPFLLYTPGEAGGGFQPIGIEEGAYRFLVNVLPEEMVDDEDAPFTTLNHCEDPPVATEAGIDSAFHRVVSHHVSYELLMRMGMEQWQVYYQRYQQMELELFSVASPITIYVPRRWLGG